MSDAYYYYLLKYNDITINDKHGAAKLINSVNTKNFNLLKYPLAMDEAKLQLMVLTLPKTKLSIKYTDDKNPNTYKQDSNFDALGTDKTISNKK